MESDTFSQSIIHTSQKHVTTFQTIHYDSTRLIRIYIYIYIYNLVGFSGCLHLWWIPLLTPELLTPELCVTSVIMNHYSLTTRLALNEFQASYYSHHRSQSALGETS